MTADFVENKAEKILSEIVCESCGESFSCGARTGECWCFGVELKSENLTDLQKGYKNCLCPNCLSKCSANRFGANGSA